MPRIGKSSEYDPHPPSVNPPKTINPRLKLKQSQSQKIEIAIKLNDGRRLQTQVNEHDQISKLIQFLQRENFQWENHFYFSTNEFPKREFKQFHLTFNQAKILTRTLLFLDRE